MNLLNIIKKKAFAENVISNFKEKIEIRIKIDKTQHADDRQDRHANITITDEDIIKTAQKAIDKITKYLVFNKLDIGDDILIHDRASNLNLICKLQSKEFGIVDLIIITVMVKKNFKPKTGTRMIYI